MIMLSFINVLQEHVCDEDNARKINYILNYMFEALLSWHVTRWGVVLLSAGTDRATGWDEGSQSKAALVGTVPVNL